MGIINQQTSLGGTTWWGATSAPPAWCFYERDTRAMTPDLGIPRSQSRGVRAFPSILQQKRLARGELATHPSVVG